MDEIELQVFPTYEEAIASPNTSFLPLVPRKTTAEEANMKDADLLARIECEGINNGFWMKEEWERP